MEDSDLNAMFLIHLTSPEREVMILLTGLKDGSRRTLAETANQCKLSQQEVADLQASALAKLREPVRKFRDSE